MDNEQMELMDPYILLSWMNMKLRDEFDCLESLCEEYGLDENRIRERLSLAGYVYRETSNQFKSAEA